MKSLIMVVVMVFVAAAAAAQSSTVTTKEVIPGEEVLPTIWIPCANGGAGELVVSSGFVKNTSHVTLHPDGAFTLVAQSNPQGVTATGVTSGNVYRGTGAIQYVLRSDAPLPIETTYVMNFGVIGPGPGNNFRLRLRMHLTITPAGIVTSSIDTTNFDCR